MPGACLSPRQILNTIGDPFHRAALASRGPLRARGGDSTVCASEAGRRSRMREAAHFGNELFPRTKAPLPPAGPRRGISLSNTRHDVMAGLDHFPTWPTSACMVFGAHAGNYEQALAMTAVITDPATVRADTHMEVTCARQTRLLLVDWLNAWVYEMATRGMLFSRFRATLADGGLLRAGARASPWTGPATARRWRSRSATCALRVWEKTKTASGIARCVVDV